MSTNLDRFSQGPPDRVAREVELVTQCEVCNRNIYPGDEYYSCDYGDCCADVDCLVALVGAELWEA
jgi:hypothetical protein